MTFVCPIWIHSRAIELRAEAAESGSWHWPVRVPDGQIFWQGAVPNRTSARVAAQRAFEERLQRTSLNRYLPQWLPLEAIVVGNNGSALRVKSAVFQVAPEVRKTTHPILIDAGSRASSTAAVSLL